MDAGAFELDEDRDVEAVRGKTAQILGGALDPAALLAEERESILEITDDDLGDLTP
jgi:hypothetical protein